MLTERSLSTTMTWYYRLHHIGLLRLCCNIVDFGNTVNYVHREVPLYYNDFELQTPLHRAPEVML